MYKYEEIMIEQAKKQLNRELNIKFTGISEDEISTEEIEEFISAFLLSKTFNGRYFSMSKKEFSRTFSDEYTVAKIKMSDEKAHFFISYEYDGDTNSIKCWKV